MKLGRVTPTAVAGAESVSVVTLSGMADDGGGDCRVPGRPELAEHASRSRTALDPAD